MRVLILESNLMWSVRFQRALEALGHEASTRDEGAFDVAIVNLGEKCDDWPGRVAGFHARGIKVVGHAGHKEKELHELGREAGCDVLATNSEMTHMLGQVLERAS